SRQFAVFPRNGFAFLSQSPLSESGDLFSISSNFSQLSSSLPVATRGIPVTDTENAATRRLTLLGWLDTVLRDLKYTFRMLARTPGFTAVAVLTLALGIGANTAIFTLLDQVLLRLLPVKD